MRVRRYACVNEVGLSVYLMSTILDWPTVSLSHIIGAGLLAGDRVIGFEWDSRILAAVKFDSRKVVHEETCKIAKRPKVNVLKNVFDLTMAPRNLSMISEFFLDRILAWTKELLQLAGSVTIGKRAVGFLLLKSEILSFIFSPNFFNADFAPWSDETRLEQLFFI